MKLLNQVKDKLAEKGYDFSDDKWTGEMLSILYDTVNATEEVLKPKDQPEWSDRKKAAFAFFDKLPEGLREMAKENYEEDYSDVIPTTLMDAIGSGFNYEESKQFFNFWNWLFRFLASKEPSITLNGITYDLTKCYEN